MWIAELWRYPVKSMAGEALETVALTEDGIDGDRIVQVRDGRGRVLTARTRPQLLRHRSMLGAGGQPLVDGRPWDAGDVARDVEKAAGAGARLVHETGPGRFDVLPLLIATDGALQAVGHDRRRFRPNIVIGGVSGLSEREWEGRRLQIGDVVIGIGDLRQRCIMTAFDPDTLEQDLGVLRRVQTEFGGFLGLNCFVIRGGTISAGAPADISPSPSMADPGR